MMTADLIARVAEELARVGIEWAGALPDVGCTARVPGVGKGARNRACAITRAADAVLVFDHSSGIGFAVRDDGAAGGLSPAELRRVRVEAQRAEAAERARELRAIERVRAEYAKAASCAAHPYLERKCVQPVPGLCCDRNGELIVPRRTIAGELVALQRIDADGSKRYSAGTPTRGTFFGIGRVDPDGVVLVAEGLATGLTVAEETGHPVAVAFDARNLEPVARALRGKYPRVAIVITGDDDRQTEGNSGNSGNPGRTKANEAARVVGGLAYFPRLCHCCRCTDWNDLAACRRRRAGGAV